MGLTFPNQSRSYDESNRRIRFSGYDGMFEVKFFLEIDALAKASADRIAGGETEYLSAFDSSRKRIIAAAEKAYGRHQKTMCTLTLADFS